MEPQSAEERSIMACPAVRSSVEITWEAVRRRLGVGGKGAPTTLRRLTCSDGDDCEFLYGPSCLLTMLRSTVSKDPTT